MNLRIFFDSIPEGVINYVFQPNALMAFIEKHISDFPKWQNASIAIIGVEEYRGSENKNGKRAAEFIRKQLYSLQKGAFDKKIVDLGNLRDGVNLEESHNRLKEVCAILFEHEVIPIIIGGGHDMSFGQFSAYQSLGKLINVISADSIIDMFGSNEFGENKFHLHKMLVSEPPLLFHYAHLGYQSYLIEPRTIDILEKLHFETYRLGQVREKFEDIEPVIRDADMFSFDISAIKRIDAPGNFYAQPFGFTGEEACQLCWYAGLSNKMSSIGFYEYNPSLDKDNQTASVIATMIWYFIEGFQLRKGKLEINDAAITKYIVSLPEEPHKITFYKDSRTEKWWIEMPFNYNKPDNANITIIPCSFSDYTAAINGEIPTRWILTQAKLH